MWHPGRAIGPTRLTATAGAGRRTYPVARTPWSAQPAMLRTRPRHFRAEHGRLAVRLRTRLRAFSCGAWAWIRLRTPCSARDPAHFRAEHAEHGPKLGRRPCSAVDVRVFVRSMRSMAAPRAGTGFSKRPPRPSWPDQPHVLTAPASPEPGCTLARQEARPPGIVQRHLQSVPKGRSHDRRVGATHRSQPVAFGGFHPPYKTAFDPSGTDS